MDDTTTSQTTGLPKDEQFLSELRQLQSQLRKTVRRSLICWGLMAAFIATGIGVYVAGALMLVFFSLVAYLGYVNHRLQLLRCPRCGEAFLGVGISNERDRFKFDRDCCYHCDYNPE
jgi:hypothetical protein